MSNLYEIDQLVQALRQETKKKKRAGYICKATLNIEFEQDQSVGLVAKLGETDRKLKKDFFSLKDFP